VTVNYEFIGAPETVYYFEVRIVPDRDPRDIRDTDWGDPYDYSGPAITGTARVDGSGKVNRSFVIGQSLGLPVPIDGWAWRVDAYYEEEVGDPICPPATGYVAKPD
jgi:hypothetical protein